MNYRICSEEKDIMSVMWNVFASFGYKDAIECDAEEGAKMHFSRLAFDKGMNCTIMLLGCITHKAMAEIAAVSIEAALAADFPDFHLEIICPEEVSDILYLYSLDEYAHITHGEFSIKGYSGDVLVFEGKCESDGIVCDFDLQAIKTAVDVSHSQVPETVVFTEPDADGIGYEIAYTMRLSGCLVTMYLGDGTIDDCENYALNNNVSSIIRVYSDGKIQIKEMASKTITETDYNTFVGYYDEPEEHEHSCGCGHEHHDHDCDCMG